MFALNSCTDHGFAGAKNSFCGSPLHDLMLEFFISEKACKNESGYTSGSKSVSINGWSSIKSVSASVSRRIPLLSNTSLSFS